MTKGGRRFELERFQKPCPVRPAPASVREVFDTSPTQICARLESKLRPPHQKSGNVTGPNYSLSYTWNLRGSLGVKDDASVTDHTISY